MATLPLGCSRGPSEPPYVDYAIVDDFPTWSPDGSTIAFQRRPPSAYGPSGLYVVAASGGTPELLTDTAYNFLSYGPKGDCIVAVGSRGLVTIATDSGEETLLAFTDNGIADPHMSSDGRWIAYVRILRAPGEPAESSGVHLVNVETGEDTPLLDGGGAVVLGGWPRWGPDASVLAYSTSSTLSTIDLRTRAVTVQATARPGTFLAHPRWVRSGSGIMFSEIGAANRTLVVDVATHQVSTWPVYVGEFSAFAPGDSAFVYRASESRSGLARFLVLYARALSDASGSSIRQLTHYTEPAEGSAAEAGEAR